MRDPRYGRDSEKHKRDHYEDEKRSRADKTLHDLRERLLSKRTSKADEDGHSKLSHREKKYRDESNDPLQGEAGMYVKEIINITTEEKKQRKEKEDGKLTDEEKAEQEQRREKLLEAGEVIFN